jgi:hypothetical protein
VLLSAPLGACFVHLDVKGFFERINTARLAEMTGLSPEIIHRHLSVEKMTARWRTKRTLGFPLRDTLVIRWETSGHSGGGREAEEAVPGGVPQGSAASSVAAEMVMGMVLRDVGALPDALLLLSYSDNIGVLVPSRTAVSAVLEALQRALVRWLGPSSIGKCSIREVADGFEYLGYAWRLDGGRVHAEPIRWRRDQWEMRLLADASRAEYHGDLDALVKLWRSVKSYCAGYAAWDGAAAFREAVEGYLAPVILRVAGSLAAE